MAPPTLTPRTIPGLPAHERAFELPGGVLVAVGVKRGLETEDQMCIKIECREIDASGRTVRDDDAPMVIPAWVVNLHKGALAEGLITMDNELATATVAAAERMQNHRAARAAWRRLPG